MSRTVIRADLVTAAMRRAGLPKAACQPLVDAVFDEIADALVRDGVVSLHEFGAFRTRKKVERPGRNPMNGRAAAVSARTVVTFRPSVPLRAAVNKGFHERK